MTDIFDSKSDATSDGTGSAEPKVTSPLDTLVGEGRKYANQEELAKAYLNADQFVETLKEENAQLREASKKAQLLEERLKRLEADLSSSSTQNADQGAGAPRYTEADIARIVEQTVSGRETAREQEANMARANQLMMEKFGDKAREIFQKEANTPALVESMKNLAAASPEKFIALFTKEAPQVGGGGEGTVNTSSRMVAQGSADEPGTKAYYNKMRRENPNQYYSQATQLQMLRDAENREKFYGRT